MGLNNFVKPYRDKSIFWHNIWKDAGSPRQGELANVKRFASYKYHWAIKTLNKHNNKMILEKTADQLLSKSYRNSWKTVRGLKGKDNRISNVIDGKVNTLDITNHFQNIYSSLYSSVDDADFKLLSQRVNNMVENKCNSKKCQFEHCHKANSKLVRVAISSLNNGKNDENFHMFSDNFLHATNKVIDV